MLDLPNELIVSGWKTEGINYFIKDGNMLYLGHFYIDIYIKKEKAVYSLTYLNNVEIIGVEEIEKAIQEYPLLEIRQEWD